MLFLASLRDACRVRLLGSFEAKAADFAGLLDVYEAAVRHKDSATTKAVRTSFRRMVSAGGSSSAHPRQSLA